MFYAVPQAPQRPRRTVAIDRRNADRTFNVNSIYKSASVNGHLWMEPSRVANVYIRLVARNAASIVVKAIEATALCPATLKALEEAETIDASLFTAKTGGEFTYVLCRRVSVDMYCQ